MASEHREEYLKTIYDIAGKDGVARITSIAKCLNLSPASATKTLQRMSDEGFVIYKPYKGATLTKEGLEIATKIKRKHRLLEVFLYDVLHINKEKTHSEACNSEACKIEPDIADETENPLCKVLKAPAKCPYRNPITPCTMVVSTCNECDLATGAQKHEVRERNIVPITDLVSCKKGVIAFLRGDKKVIQRISDLGLTLHTEIELIRKAPMNGPVEVRVRRTNLAIAREIADNIFVTIEG